MFWLSYILPAILSMHEAGFISTERALEACRALHSEPEPQEKPQ